MAVINCDVDGVLNNLMEIVVEVFNNRYGTNYSISDITTYNLSNCFESSVANLMKNIFEEPDIWDKVKPTDGAQEALQKLVNSGHQVYLVTNNSPYTFPQKFDWIRNYFPFIEPSRIVCMSDKWLLNADIMIEDCYETLIVKPYYFKICYDQPWNQSNKDDVRSIYRCYNWENILATVNKICDEE